MVKHLQPVSFEGQPTSQASRNSSSGGVSFHEWLDVGALLPPPTVAGQESRWVMTRPGHQACWKNIPFFWMLRFLDEWWYLYLSVPCNILCHSLSSTNSRRQCWKQNVLDECTSWSTCTLTLTVRYLEWPSEVSACSFLSCTPPMFSVDIRCKLSFGTSGNIHWRPLFPLFSIPRGSLKPLFFEELGGDNVACRQALGRKRWKSELMDSNEAVRAQTWGFLHNSLRNSLGAALTQFDLILALYQV